MLQIDPKHACSITGSLVLSSPHSRCPNPLHYHPHQTDIHRLFRTAPPENLHCGETLLRLTESLGGQDFSLDSIAQGRPYSSGVLPRLIPYFCALDYSQD